MRVVAVIVAFVGAQVVLWAWPLTVNSDDDSKPQIDGKLVVWSGHDGNDYEIFLYDGKQTTQLTDNGYNDEEPQIDGNNVVWKGQEGNNDWEIFHRDIRKGITTQITNNSDNDIDVRVSTNGMVWVSEDETDAEIHFSPIPTIWR